MLILVATLTVGSLATHYGLFHAIDAMTEQGGRFEGAAGWLALIEPAKLVAVVAAPLLWYGARHGNRRARSAGMIGMVTAVVVYLLAAAYDFLWLLIGLLAASFGIFIRLLGGEEPPVVPLVPLGVTTLTLNLTLTGLALACPLVARVPTASRAAS